MDDARWQAVNTNGTILTARYRFPGGTSRTTIVRGDDTAIVYSPGLPLARGAAQGVGAVARVWLVAPSAGHTLGVAAWQQQLAHARVIADAPTAERLRKHGVDCITPLDLAKNEIASTATLLAPPGNGTGELWLRVPKPAQTYWIVADAYMNLAALAPGFWLRLAQRLYGLRLGLDFGRVFRSRLADRNAYAAWLRDQFATLGDGTTHVLIPCHGEIDDGADLRARLEAVTQPKRRGDRSRNDG